MSELVSAQAGYQPTRAEVDEVLAWFARYDRLVTAGDVEAMADMAAFPINEVTDDADGLGLAGPCSRERFVEQMHQVVGGAGETSSTSTRHPIFLSASLVFVVTDAEITAGGEVHRMRYGDLLIKCADGWRFQTMVAGGRADQMRGLAPVGQARPVSLGRVVPVRVVRGLPPRIVLDEGDGGIDAMVVGSVRCAGVAGRGPSTPCV